MMKLKKIPYYFSIALLTGGASLILGLLSFGGMFALWPILPLAFAAFALSVGYEGEIYLQNIKGALSKLFKPNYLQYQFANHYLHTFFPDTRSPDCPQFFKDYETQLDLHHQFEHKRLNKESRARQKQVTTTLNDMEKWFSTQLFAKTRKPSAFEKELHTLLAGHHILHVKNLADAKNKTNIFVFNDINQKLFFIDSTGKRTRKNLSDEFIQQLQSHLYQAELQQWLSGCDLQCVATTPKLINPTLKNRYVFVEKTKELFHFNANGEGEPISISSKNRTEFAQNISAVMGTKKIQHLTPEQLKTLTTSTNDKRTLVTMQSDLQRIQQQKKDRQFTFQLVRIGSLFAALFMGLGTTYLLVSTFTIIPFLAALPITIWPLVITPMALIAGTAYGLLTYNAVTDMVANDSLRAWYKKLRESFNQGVTLSNVLMALATACVFTLTFALTICTAGTWWTVVKSTQPLFAWMRRVPSFIMQILAPVFIGFSTLGFNLENTAETLKEIDKAANRTYNFSFAALIDSLQAAFERVRAKENWWQILNPFRIILKLTVTPLRILLFIGHLISIGVTSDRLPGVSEIFSALLGIISEGFEDAHYFFSLNDDHEHQCGDTQSRLDSRFGEGHEHSHANDIPTRVLKGLFFPIYWLAAYWDKQASKLNRLDPIRPILRFEQALEKQMGLEPKTNVVIDKKTSSPSYGWKKQHVLYVLHKQQTKLASTTFNHDIAQKKIAALGLLQEEVQALDIKQPKALNKALSNAQKNKIYQTHRAPLTLFDTACPTDTSALLDELPMRVQSPTSVTESVSEQTHPENCKDSDCKQKTHKAASKALGSAFCSFIRPAQSKSVAENLDKQPILNDYLTGAAMMSA